MLKLFFRSLKNNLNISLRRIKLVGFFLGKKIINASKIFRLATRLNLPFKNRTINQGLIFLR